MRSRKQVDRVVAGASREGCARGKSELRRAGCWVTPSGGDPKESATEIKPPAATSAREGGAAGKGETVRQERTSGRATGRLGKPHPEQDQIGGA